MGDLLTSLPENFIVRDNVKRNIENFPLDKHMSVKQHSEEVCNAKTPDELRELFTTHATCGHELFGLTVGTVFDRVHNYVALYSITAEEKMLASVVCLERLQSRLKEDECFLISKAWHEADFLHRAVALIPSDNSIRLFYDISTGSLNERFNREEKVLFAMAA
ncbi:MAG: hypothetical protein NXH87_05395 [Rhodobiaceae bacterium]|nr:hypothetical protein [Rhodobiaceae bacterium]